MSEMLGNQFFMARNYPAAQKELEEAFLKDPQNISVKKKLVICYTQTGKLKDAINLFSKLLNENIEFIINTDPELDDCPCPELIEKIGNFNHQNESSFDHLLTLAIIWLYCDENKSLEYFKKLHELEPNNLLINQSIKKIESFIRLLNSN
ncbi:MAG: tetratricopeptide repeat protein [Melioribacteraceae bacterium]|nr:tetratricopeptide repeat protein [Melioribacteraceae bacterium]